MVEMDEMKSLTISQKLKIDFTVVKIDFTVVKTDFTVVKIYSMVAKS